MSKTLSEFGMIRLRRELHKEEYGENENLRKRAIKLQPVPGQRPTQSWRHSFPELLNKPHQVKTIHHAAVFKV